MQKIKLYIKKSRDIFKNIKYCLYLSTQASIYFTIVRLLAKILLAFFPLGITWCTKYLIDTISQNHSININMVCTGIGGYGLFSIATLLMQKINSYVTALHTDKLNHLLEKVMMNKAILAEIELFDNPEYYNRFQNTKKDIYTIGDAIWNIIDLFSMIISVCGSGWILWKLNPLVSILICVLSIPAVCQDYHYTRILYDWECGNVDNERKRNYLYTLATEKTYAQELRLYNIGEGITERYQQLWNKYIGNKVSIIKSNTWKNLILLFPIEICKLGIIAYIVYEILKGKCTLGDFSLYIGAMGQMVNSMYVMINSLALVGENQMKIENVEGFYRFCSKKMYEGNRTLNGDVEICFEHVYFSYPGTEKNILNDVNFIIHSGERVALVGTNGSGKSTIIKLLLRFYDVTDGRILLNNIPIKEYSRTEIRRHFSVLFQEFVTYAFTLEENIKIEEAMGRKKESCKNIKEEKNEYKKVIKESGIREILNKLPEKDKTYITRRFNERGAELSRGQYQKLALARALYRKGDIVLLDEPSSALDPNAEYEIFRAMDKYCRKKMMLFVTHRLDNVRFADKIIYLEDGKVESIGTEEELLRNGSGYAKLWKISHL